MATAVLSGTLLGAACLATDQLRSPLTALGQLVTPWVLVAAVVGSRARTWRGGAGLGATALVVADVAYAVAGVVARGLGPRTLLWAVVALAVGPVGGLVGWTSRRGLQPLRPLALGSLATVAVAEAAVVWQHVRLERAAATAVAVLVTVACCAVAARGGAGRLAGPARVVGVLVVLSVPATLVLETLLGAVGVITT